MASSVSHTEHSFLIGSGHSELKASRIRNEGALLEGFLVFYCTMISNIVAFTELEASRVANECSVVSCSSSLLVFVSISATCAQTRVRQFSQGALFHANGFKIF